MEIKYGGFMRDRVQRRPVTIGPDASFFDAQRLVREKGIRHLPVVDKNNHLVGIVTDSDIREAAPSDATALSIHELNYLLGRLKVSGFMTPKKKLITVSPDALVEEAFQLMHDNKIGCLPVVENKKLYGIFTETDALEVMTTIFGLKEKGTRLTIALEDRPGALLGMFEIFNKFNVNVISFLLVPFMIDDKGLAVLRVKKGEYKSLIKELEKSGYPVLSKGHWLS
jgi:acetoin utilization protein AcuB